MAQSIEEWAIPARDLDDKALAGQLRTCRDRWNQLAIAAAKRGIAIDTKLMPEAQLDAGAEDRIVFGPLKITKRI